MIIGQYCPVLNGMQPTTRLISPVDILPLLNLIDIFNIYSIVVVTHLAVVWQNSVARDDDGDRIYAHGSTYSLGGHPGQAISI